jgi:hypothetical protein
MVSGRWQGFGGATIIVALAYGCSGSATDSGIPAAGDSGGTGSIGSSSGSGGNAGIGSDSSGGNAGIGSDSSGGNAGTASNGGTGGLMCPQGVASLALTVTGEDFDANEGAPVHGSFFYFGPQVSTSIQGGRFTVSLAHLPGGCNPGGPTISAEAFVYVDANESGSCEWDHDLAFTLAVYNGGEVMLTPVSPRCYFLGGMSIPESTLTTTNVCEAPANGWDTACDEETTDGQGGVAGTGGEGPGGAGGQGAE